MNGIKTVFFDWGGVIANDPGDGFLAQLFRKLGATESQAEEIYDTYTRSFMRGELTEAEYWSKLRLKYGLAIHDTISEEFKNWQGLIKNDDILAVASAAKAKGIQIAILSNVMEPTYNVLQQAGCYDLFDKVIASCKVGFAKPEPQIYQIALDELNTTAEQSLFIDDKQSNLGPADKLGFKTLLAQNPQQIIEELTALLEL